MATMKKWSAPVVVMAVGAGVMVLLLRIQTPARAQVAGRLWGATSLGGANCLAPGSRLDQAR